MVIDSTILVDVIRGKTQAKEFLEQTKERLVINRVGIMELARGAKTKTEITVVKNLIKKLGIEIVEISPEISQTAGDIFEKFWHSHALGAMDAFIAATALVLKEKLATHNLKRFKFIKDLDLTIPY